MTTYLLPPSPRPGDGTDRAHIDRDGRPACGCRLDGPYAVSGWLYAYEVCEDCVKVSEGGQMGLFGEVGRW